MPESGASALSTETAITSDLLERVASVLRSHSIDVAIVDTADEARATVLALVPEGAQVLALVPEGAQVHSGKSKTLEDVGLYSELMESGRYDALRPKLFAMDRATQAAEMRRLIAAPDFMIGSVAAVTEDGALVAASATGSQLGPYAATAGRLILVVGSQKIVPDLDAALRRIREVVFPYENAQVQARLGVDTILEKVLIIFGEWIAGRTTVILVRDPVGI